MDERRQWCWVWLSSGLLGAGSPSISLTLGAFPAPRIVDVSTTYRVVDRLALPDPAPVDWDSEVEGVARRAGITKPIGPHSLRHAFITAALDAGVPLRDVQEAASHADPRTTMRYDRAIVSLDRHATYIVSTFIAGASR